MLTPFEMMKLAVKTLDSKKAQDIKVLKTDEVTILADYFIICTANSTTQIKTLADEVAHYLEVEGEMPLRTEGQRAGGWVLVDFGAIVVHILLKEAREFYNLERLWSDAASVDISEFIIEE